MLRRSLQAVSNATNGRTLIAAVGLIALAGCANQAGEELNTQSRSMVGMSKAQLISCAGRPQKTIDSGSGELLSPMGMGGR